MKIATILGARPQFIKAALVSKNIKKNTSLDEIIIHTGQHYEKNMSDIFFEEMMIPKPKYNLNINQKKYELMIEKMTKGVYNALKQESADGVIVYGDTNSTLAGSFAANKLNIPIFHIESGLRSYDRTMHEEINRIITDHLSALLFVPTKGAMQNLNKENITKDIIFSGDVMFDAYKFFSNQLNARKYVLPKSPYILATIHRRENICSKEKLSAIFNDLEKINSQVKVIMPIHPHTKKKLKDFKIQSKINFINPLGYQSMLAYLNGCEMVVCDSGGLQKESFFAKKKCVVVRKNTEWTELISEKTSMLSNCNKIFETFKEIKQRKVSFSKNLYGNGNACEIIANSVSKYFC